MEENIRGFVNKRRGQAVDVSHVECRSTACEIQAFIHDADTMPTDWDRMIGAMYREDWFDFSHSSSTGDNNVRMAIFHRPE